MQVSRVVKIAVNDQSSIWKELSKIIFSDFVFRIPKQLTNKTYLEDGAQVLLEFVPETQELIKLSNIKSDPYERPYLYLNVVKVKSSAELPEPVVHKIQHWIAEAALLGTQWCVFIVQEESSFFDSAKPINKTNLVTESSQLSKIVVMQIKKKQKLTDQTVELIRQTIKIALIESFDSYIQETKKKISQSLASNQQATPKLNAQLALLLFYYGFTEEAFQTFMKTYNQLLPTIKDPLSQNLRLIDTSYITNYPYDELNDPYSVMFFCLHGAMAVQYNRTRFSELIDLFLSHIGYLIEVCHTPEQLSKVQDYEETCIKRLLATSGFVSTPSVVAKLTERLYYLQIHKNSDEAGETYKQLMNVLPTHSSKSKSAANTKYINWALSRNLKLPAFSDDISFWKIGTKAANVYLDESINKNSKAEIEKYSSILLNDKSSYAEKELLIQRLMIMPSQIKLVEPFSIKVSVESSTFGGRIQQAKCVPFTVKITLPSWFNEQISSLEVQFDHDEDDERQIEIASQPDLKKVVDFKTYFMVLGRWNVTCIRMKLREMTMEWKYSDYFATFEVIPLEHPYIDIHLPALTCLWKSMKIGLSTDFTDIDYPNISLSISFSGDAIKIPSQKGKATVDNNSTCTYILDDKGELQFFLNDENGEDESNKMSLSQHKIKMQLDFMMEKQTDTSDIIVKTDVGGISFEERNKVSFKFPIECNIRLQTEDFTHVCLHNTSEIDLVIESAEIMPDTWGKMDLKAGSDVFLLARHTPDTQAVLNIFVSERFGSSIANSWDLNEKVIATPAIDVVIADEKLIEGEPTEISLTLPQCTYHVMESEDVLISGNTKQKFDGGVVTFTLIPIHANYVKLPNIIINDVVHVMNPMFLNVEKTTIPVMTPLVEC